MGSIIAQRVRSIKNSSLIDGFSEGIINAINATNGGETVAPQDDVLQILAGETIPDRRLVSIHDDGLLYVANNTDEYRVIGFVSSGGGAYNRLEVQTIGKIISGDYVLNSGEFYYITAGGLVSDWAGVSAGDYIQRIGIALSVNEILLTNELKYHNI